MKRIVSLCFFFAAVFAPWARAQSNTLQSKPTAASPAGDDWLYLQGATNDVRKLSPSYYLPTATAASTYQPLDADLTAIAALSGTNTIYYRSGANTWSPVTIGSNLTFSAGTLSATGGGGGSGTVTSVDISGGTTGLTFSGGPITASGSFTVGGTLAVANGGTGATTASGARSALGVAIGSNVQAWDADLDALAALSGTNTLYYRSGANTWSAVTIGSNLTFSGGTLAASAGGSGVSQTNETVAQFTAAGTTTLARPNGSDFHTAFLDAGAGSGSYTRVVVLNTTNTPTDGDQIRVVVKLPTSSNPTVEVRNSSAGGTLLDTISNPSATGDTIALDYVYLGGSSAWVRASTNATRTNNLTNTASSAAVDDYLQLDGATNGIRKILASNLGGGMTNPMTTSQDIIVGGASGTPTRLAKGTNNQVLTVVSGNLAWATPSSGFADPMTTAGDIIIRNGSNTTARLGVGTSGQVLTVSGGVPAWADPTGSGSSTFGDLANYYQLFDDFDALGSTDGNGNNMPTGWVFSQGAATAVVAVTSTSKHPGIARITTANSGNSRCTLYRNSLGFTTGQGAITFTALVRAHLLNGDAGSETRFGLLDQTDMNSSVTNAVYFSVSSTGAVTLKSVSGGTTTSSSTSTTMSLDTWYLFSFTINAGGTSIQAQVNGTNAGSAITTNIPSGVGFPGIASRDNGSSSTATNFDCDYVKVVQAFSSAR